jgi:hypothetical protein
VCHYIHLNPVRAGIVAVERLPEYRHSSYWFLWHPEGRPVFLDLRTALSEAGGLVDTAAGRRSYAEYLVWQAAEGPAGKTRAYASLSHGWALGTKEFKAALVKDHQLAADARAWESAGAREIRELDWDERLGAGLRRVGKTAEDARRERKSAAWKVALAAELKQTTQATNGWIAERLNMGSGVAVSQYVGRWRRAAARPDGKEALECKT